MTFSIITTVLNNESFILDCLESVKKQNINKKEIEHIIIDGGSNDKTVNIIKKFKKNNKYVKFFYQKNLSIYEGINFGIKKSKNDHIGILHSDDYYFDKNVLNVIKKKFNNKKNIQAIYSNALLVNRFKKRIQRK